VADPPRVCLVLVHVVVLGLACEPLALVFPFYHDLSGVAVPLHTDLDPECELDAK
jgi:hypothetical protein